MGSGNTGNPIPSKTYSSFPAAAIGVFAGWLFAGDTDEDVVRIIIGCVGLIFLAMRQWGRLGAAVSRAL